MNITEFAEQIVFGKTLEDKLLIPGRLSLDSRAARPEFGSLISPGRPKGMEMAEIPGSSGRNVQPPRDDNLENESERGKLLHFLANHELLATELMALVLLKFPDAPHAFRQGVLVTLQEEQEHTRMYLRRMKECGVEFGSFPLSGQFWRVVEPMQDPIDFVSRLSLTFEQANLDFSLHFAGVFRKIGDTTTADLLQKIYEDEIGHVQHGLHWFRQWKNPELSDWEAYQQSLEFPMSPARGRGLRGAFNREGRLRAGLNTEFIDAIEVFRQSRGRAPTVRWFDPGAEAELAGELAEATSDVREKSQSVRSTQLTDQLGKDLELVMAAMAKRDDVVLVRNLPSREFKKQLIEAGFDLPEFALIDDRTSLRNRKLHDFSPWAWTPNNHDIALPLHEFTRHPPRPWNDHTTELFRKSWSAQQLKNWLQEPDEETPDWFSPADTAGTAVFAIEDVAATQSEIAARGYTTVIFKTDLGASGRGQRRLPVCGPLSPEDEAWLGSMFPARCSQEDTPVAIIEPQLNRVVDLSFLWHMPRDEATPNFVGWTRSVVTAGRRYAGTRLGNSLTGCDTEMIRFLMEDRGNRIQTVIRWLQPRLARELAAKNFTGYYGVDAFAYRDGSDLLRIKPLVELNPRTTMGHVAFALEKRLAPGINAEFRILTKIEWRQLYPLLDQIPLTMSRDGRLKSGAIWLGEVDDDTRLVPVLVVGGEAMAVVGEGTQ